MTGTLGTSGSKKTGNWVTDGMQFFLVDLNSGAAISSLTVHVTGASPPPTGTVTMSADPDPIAVAFNATTGSTTLSWKAPGYNRLVVRINSPNGKSVTGTVGPTGSITTGNWVTDGMVFYLVNLDSGAAIGSITMHVERGLPPPGSVTFTADPNPILVGTGVTTGQTTLSWKTPGISPLSIHLNSQQGPVVAQGLPASGSLLTGEVTDGTEFVLMDDSIATALAWVSIGFKTVALDMADAVAGTYYAAYEVVEDGVGLPAIRQSRWCTDNQAGTYALDPPSSIPSSMVTISKISETYLLTMHNTGSSLAGYTYLLYPLNPASNSLSMGGLHSAYAYAINPWQSLNGVDYYSQAFPYLTFTRNPVTGRIRVVAFNSILANTYSFEGVAPADTGNCQAFTYHDDILFNYYKDH
jgi:hypothetical protein